LNRDVEGALEDEDSGEFGRAREIGHRRLWGRWVRPPAPHLHRFLEAWRAGFCAG
jgi:hypothetical protein